MTTPNDSRDFYPTPDNLAWEKANSLQSTKCGRKHLPQPILEPSAGDGALARQIHAVADIRHDPKTGELDRYSTSKAKEFDLDCVELSSDFRAKLKKDGFRVVHDDFLTFRPAKKYAAIIMNPPYSAGAAHLLKALEIMKDGGKIRCLLNAETIRNPYTNERKELAQKLNELNAQIKYIPDAFKNARRAAVVHLLFNVIGVVVLLTVFCIVRAALAPALLDESASMAGIAVAHSAFNILCTALLLPAGGLLETLAKRIVPDDAHSQDEQTTELDVRLLPTPSLALRQSRSVACEMAGYAVRALDNAIDALSCGTPELAQSIHDDEERCDHYEDILGTYLVKLSAQKMGRDESEEATELLKTIGDFERISDHAVNILSSAEELERKGLTFSGSALNELSVLTAAVREILSLSLKAFSGQDPAAAQQVEPLEQVIDTLKEQMRTRHILRMQQGACSIEAGFVLSDLLTDLERTSDHCSNIAGCIIDAREHNLNLHETLRQARSDDGSFQHTFEHYVQKYQLPIPSNG